MMTFNIRYDNPDDGIHRWDARKQPLAGFLIADGSDIIGIQEGLYHQLQFLDSCLTQYTYVGEGRDDGKLKGEFCAVFYDTTKYSVVSHETFWLSRTPEKVSVGWNASMERICTSVLFLDKATGNCFFVYNLHLDHISAKARRKSVRLVLKKAGAQNKYPFFIMGDFNASETENTIRYMKKALGDLSENNFSGPLATFQNFGREEQGNRIDYIFSDQKEACISYSHLNVNYRDNLYLSDHRPVKAVFEIK